MDLITVNDVLYGLGQLADLRVVAWLALGVIIGMIFGAVPGLTVIAALAIMTPLTFTLNFEASMALLLGIYVAGYFAGSIPAILINTPGVPSNAATTVDGYPMALNGEADRAIALAVSCSFIGGIISALVLATLAPTLAKFAFSFTSVEYFGLALLGLVCVAAVSGRSLFKGIAGACLGILIATIGIDPISGVVRFDFGMPELQGGVPLLPALLGLFAITELLNKAAEADVRTTALPPQKAFRLVQLFGIFLRNKWLTLKSALIGVSVGVLPGTGPVIASWIAYGEAARNAKADDKFGKGEEKGVIACETSNNAVTGGALVPLLTVGIPGDPVCAVLIGALLFQGIDPGPFFIAENGNLFVHILAMLVAGNFLMLIFTFAGRRALPYIVRVPTHTLVPLVAVMSAAGGYAINATGFDVALIIIGGLFGYTLFRFGFPIAPVLLGIVLGPYVEENLRNALVVHDGDFTAFVTRPVSAVLLVVIVVLMVFFGYTRRKGTLAVG